MNKNELTTLQLIEDISNLIMQIKTDTKELQSLLIEIEMDIRRRKIKST